MNSIEKIKVKTKAKTTNRVLEAIINQHFVVLEYPTLLTRDAVKMILENFDVTPKPNNQFNLE